MKDFNHFNSRGEPRMVDVGEKSSSERRAVAESRVCVSRETVDKIDNGNIKKGDPYSVARIAAIMGAKKTSDIIPMCHPIAINGVDISVRVERGEKSCRVVFQASVSCSGKTGVEMEALTAVSVAALTFYDMCKSADRGMVIEEIRLLEKIGGKSGHWKKE